MSDFIKITNIIGASSPPKTPSPVPTLASTPHISDMAYLENPKASETGLKKKNALSQSAFNAKIINISKMTSGMIFDFTNTLNGLVYRIGITRYATLDLGKRKETGIKNKKGSSFLCSIYLTVAINISP